MTPAMEKTRTMNNTPQAMSNAGTPAGRSTAAVPGVPRDETQPTFAGVDNGGTAK